MQWGIVKRGTVAASGGEHFVEVGQKHGADECTVGILRANGNAPGWQPIHKARGSIDGVDMPLDSTCAAVAAAFFADN